MSLSVTIDGSADATVHDDGEQIARIHDLRLVFARFRPGGNELIGPSYPLFLFWMQYANHEDPERNAGTNGAISVVAQTPDNIALVCKGTTASGACVSTTTLAIRRHEDPVRYVYSVRTTLEVRSGWLVTPNPTQGEVEFANLWPAGTFSALPSDRQHFQSCLVARKNSVERIPHHHLESTDKHNILMTPGDRFVWVEEDENLCLTFTGRKEVHAGLCAYMWDAHFAYKVCTNGKDVVLPTGTQFDAAYEIRSLSRAESAELSARANVRPGADLHAFPLYIVGGSDLIGTARNIQGDWRYVWPWETETSANARFTFENESRLRIESSGEGISCWKLTTLGPAYGGRPLADGSQYRLSASVKTLGVRGTSTIAIRLHRENRGSVFEMKNYETYRSDDGIHGDGEWTKLEITTPRISPPPDRIHLLMIQEDAGTTWFEHLSFEVLA